MSKKTKKLSLKKETLRTLSSEQLNGVAGGTDSGNYMLSKSGVRPPPPGTFGCETDGAYALNINYAYPVNYIYKIGY